MELRPELVPPPLDMALFNRLRELGERITGPEPESSAALEEFQRLTGRGASREDFGDYVENDTILYYLLPPSILIRNLSDAEIMELYRRIDAEGTEHLTVAEEYQFLGVEKVYQLGYWSAILSRSFLGGDCTPEGFAEHHAQKQRILEWERETGTIWGVDF